MFKVLILNAILNELDDAEENRLAFELLELLNDLLVELESY